MTTKILAFNTTKSHYEPLTCDDDGKLLVSGITGGGGSGGDASATLQQEQIEVAEASNVAIFQQLAAQTDRVLYDTDIIANNISNSNLALCSRLDSIDVSANNMEVQLDKLQFTSANLHVRDDATLSQLEGSNLAINTKLGLIAEASEDLLLSVDGISAKMNALQIQSAKYTIEAVSQFAPDTIPSFSTVAGIPKDEGWYYKNLVNGQVSQLYFYSYLNPAMSVAGRQFAYQLNDITMSYCVVKLIAVNSAEGLPTLAIYTRPTGSGDAVPGFFKSRKVYNIPSTAKLTQGMEVMLYWGVEPSLRLHPTVARIELQLVSTIGPALGTEQLAFLSLNTDSASLAGNAEYVVSAAGFQYGGELIMDTQFTGESSESVVSSDASAANQVSSNTAVCTRLDTSNNTLGLINANLDQLTYSGSNLFVKDSQVSAEIASLNSTIGQGIFVLMDSNPPISGGMRLFGADSNLFVYDSQTHSELLTLNAEIDGVIDNSAGALKVVGDFYLPVQPVEFETPQSVNLYSGGAALTYTQTGASQYSLDVHVNNSTAIPVSGSFFQETQPVSIEKLSFTAGDELIVYDDYSFQELQALNGKVVTCDTSNVIISGTVPISSASALSVTETNPITDYSTETTLSELSTLVANQSAYNRFQVEAPVSDGKLDTIITNMSLTNFNVNNLTKCDTDNVAIPAGVSINGTVAISSASPLSVTETNPITDYATETTCALIKTQTDKLTFLDIDTNTNNLKVIDTALNQQLSQFSFFTGEDEITDLRVRVMNTNLDIGNFPETQAVSVADPVDTHLYASSSGSSWHRVKSDNNGQLIVNSSSSTLDGAGNEITSETFGSGGVSRGLHTIIGNTSLAVTGGVTVSANQYGSFGNLANNVPTILPGAVTSGLNVSNWSYFLGAYEDFNGMTTGTISLEYSFDNITYYTLFNTQIFPSGTGTPRRANINKQDIPAVNWIRLRNGTSSTLQSVTVTLLGASLS